MKVLFRSWLAARSGAVALAQWESSALKSTHWAWIGGMQSGAVRGISALSSGSGYIKANDVCGSVWSAKSRAYAEQRAWCTTETTDAEAVPITSYVMDVTEHTYEDLVVKEHTVPVIVQAHALWCRPCRNFSPV